MGSSKNDLLSMNNYLTVVSVTFIMGLVATVVLSPLLLMSAMITDVGANCLNTCGYELSQDFMLLELMYGA